MKIRLCDNFKTTNAMTLIKVILESPFMSSVALTNPKAMRHEYLKTTRTFFTGSSVFNYPQRLNCYDFPITFINQTNYIFSFQISVDWNWIMIFSQFARNWVIGSVLLLLKIWKFVIKIGSFFITFVTKVMLISGKWK